MFSFESVENTGIEMEAGEKWKKVGHNKLPRHNRRGHMRSGVYVWPHFAVQKRLSLCGTRLGNQSLSCIAGNAQTNVRCQVIGQAIATMQKGDRREKTMDSFGRRNSSAA